MALITRFARLFRADLHAVLDRVEEPDVLLKQAMREMEADTARDQQRLKLTNHELGRLDARRSDLNQSVAQIDDEMDICFGSGKDDLARVLIRRKLEAQFMLKALAGKHRELTEVGGELKLRLTENQERLQAMRQKAELLSEGDSAERRQDWTIPPATVRDEDVEVAFLREKQSRAAS